MRIGLVSDIHGNAAALEAALALLADADMVCCLGDAISEHRFSNEVVRMLRDRHVPTIRGNHEAMFFSCQGERARAASWIERDLLDWLAGRPREMELHAGGKRVRLVHAASWTESWPYVFSGGAEFGRFAECGADFVAYGHTHQPVVRRVGATLVVNPGSVGEGRPTPHGFELSCALLDTDIETVAIRQVVTDASRPEREGRTP